jgi:predicted RNase H-like HicB family nuclease
MVQTDADAGDAVVRVGSPPGCAAPGLTEEQARLDGDVALLRD